MKHLSSLIAGIAGIIALVHVPSLARADAPASWTLAGSAPADYEIGVDRSVTRVNHASGVLAAKVAKPNGFGTLMQVFAADSYRGKRVRFSAYVKSDHVADWAGLWMRVDSARKPASSFDNMEDRPIKGTTDWTKYDVVLDVAPDADDIAFGVLESGAGKVWIDGLAVEVVDTSVKTTGSSSQLAKTPQNLDFAK